MANEIYSRPLSQEAKVALIDFIEAYLESLKSQRADQGAETAKEKAKAVLATDIDILNFVTVIAVMHSPAGIELLHDVIIGRAHSRNVATAIIKIFEEARRIDISFRTS